jgi:hypothetical protein
MNCLRERISTQLTGHFMVTPVFCADALPTWVTMCVILAKARFVAEDAL